MKRSMIPMYCKKCQVLIGALDCPSGYRDIGKTLEAMDIVPFCASHFALQKQESTT